MTVPTLRRSLPLLLALVAPFAAQAAEQAAAPTAVPDTATVPFSAAQIQSLGITTARPQPVEAAAGVPLSARVVAAADAEWVVTAQAGGVLVRLPVSEGDVVRAGTVLAELRSAEAPAMSAELAQAESAAKLARSERDRDRQLHAEGIIAERRLQASEQAATQADARLDAVRTRFRLMGLSGADAARGRVLLRAPNDATVIERLAMPGQRLAEADPVLRLVDAGRLMLELQVPVADAGFAAGDRLRLPDGREAVVRQPGWAASEAAQTVRVLAALPAGASGLRPGQWLKVQREKPVTRAAWRLPSTAVVRRDRAAYVFVRDAQGFRAVPVEVLADDAGSATVAAMAAAALGAGDEVARSGTIAIKGAWLGHGGSD